MISIILVNWNGWADTIFCINSLLESNPPKLDMRIIVVDNASTNESVELFRCWEQGNLCLLTEYDMHEAAVLIGSPILHNYCFVDFDNERQQFNWNEQTNINYKDRLPSVYYISGKINGGFGFGCNIGMKLSMQLGTDVIWLLNNDCIVSSDTVQKIALHVANHPNEIVGTRIRYFYFPERIQAIGGGTINRLTGKFQLQTAPSFLDRLDYIHGASMAFHVSCVDKVGYFDERIFMYCEEVDYCLRSSALGFKFSVIPVDVFHKEGGSQGGSLSVNAWAHVLFNKYYVLNKHFGWGWWVFVYFAMMFSRVILPIGQVVERRGAKIALFALLLRKNLF
jgi:GT2 family glycosyltransferase